MFQEQTVLNGEWPEMIEQRSSDIMENVNEEEFMWLLTVIKKTLISNLSERKLL